jgi:outer membrane beta-barrel protein
VRSLGCGVAALSALAVLGGLVGRSARADKPSESDVPSCLDQSITDELGRTLRPRGVQRRVFLKRARAELVLRGGVFAADIMSSSYQLGGALAYFPTEDFGVELAFDLTPIALDMDEPLADFFGDDRFEEPGNGYLAFANALWSPIHAKLKLGDHIVHADIMLSLGAGRVFHDTVQGVSFDTGVVVELLTTGWLTLRFEARDVIAVQEAVTETRLTNNLSATMGVGFWTPSW